jgi:hypothetical protein
MGNIRRQIAVGTICTLVVAALIVTLTSAGAAPGSATPGDGAPVQFAPQRGQIPFLAGSASDVLKVIASRLPLVANARLVTEAIPGEEGSSTTGNVLEYDLLVPGFNGAAIAKASWEGDLLTGALIDEYAARGLGSIVETNATLVDPSGARQPIGGGFGNVVSDQIFASVPNSLADQVAAGAAQFGLHSVSLSRVQGLQEAPVIVATTDQPRETASALEQPSALASLLGGPPSMYEGLYIEVRDTSGAPVYIAATASRAGASTVWIAPSLGVVGDGASVPSS